jgi:hypothetical protein
VKSAACECLGHVARSVGAQAFAPYLEKSLEALCDRCDYFHEDVRAGVRVALEPLVQVPAPACLPACLPADPRTCVCDSV